MVMNLLRFSSVPIFFLFFQMTLAHSAISSIRPQYDTAPRPGLMPEEIIVLDGKKWDFAVGDTKNYDHKIQFGFAPESELSGVDYEELRDKTSSEDIVWYRKSLDIPSDWEGALLTFEGIDYEAQVFINDELVKIHQGAYAPFDIDISRFLNSKKPLILSVRASDDRENRQRSVGKQERRPFEGVIFYGNSTGAWKGAFLRKINPNLYLKNLKMRTHSKGLFAYEVEIVGAAKNTTTLEITISDRMNKRILAKNRSISRLGEFQVNDVSPWSPENPQLYNVTVELYQNDKLIERIRSYTGFSDFVQRDGYFRLNNAPYYVRGVLNQMVYPKGLYTPETPLDNNHDLLMIKSHGFNFHRVHQTTPRWRDIYEMEKLGVAWSLEMPSARDLRDRNALSQFVAEWKEIIKAYGWGHPGLFYFVPVNEDWGMLEDHDHYATVSDSVRESFQLELLNATIQSAPPGALVSPGDGWRQITGGSQLILSAHDYRGSFKELLDAYGEFPVNAPRGTVFPRNGKELILAPYIFPGSDVAPVLGEFGGKSFAPAGVGNVFGYGRIYRELDLWLTDSLAQMAAMGELSIFRGGYVYTQLRDAGFKPHRPVSPDRPGGELNGFLTADGVPKSDPGQWHSINIENQKKFQQHYDLYQTLERGQ
jgi:hypothetical protein